MASLFNFNLEEGGDTWMFAVEATFPHFAEVEGWSVGSNVDGLEPSEDPGVRRKVTTRVRVE